MSKTETPDIVSLLRERGEWKDGGKVWEQDALCAVAAAEIERLRSELAKQGETWRKTLHVERECSLNETRLKDQFRSRALATEAELAKHQWRTIESAPRDREILVVGGTAYDSMSTLTKRGAVQLAGFLSQEVTYTGSIQGHVHSIGVAELFFQLRRMRTNELIRCEFKEDLYQEILDACEPRNSRIFVHGKITARRVDRHISLIRVDGVRSAPRLSDEKYSSFFGYDPNYTGDISSVEFSERATRYEQ